ncbi:putative bifunctional diguanylate cyclase/phosphodiesterase [Ferrimonas kyonanensis]|uniref:putative bifunctional diguanylate cyclase/phosphodiesterase n=1 Tax=Ferrimonas kyonanensis TaxID=364763 RepID=UPI000406EC70|nr:phosphodiesterase [Ferrimonas kyonanensis]
MNHTAMIAARPGSKRTATWLFAVFLVVALMVAAMSWVSVRTGFMVQEDSEQMVQRHIPEMEAIGVLQAALSQQVNQLYLYYATTDRPPYLSRSRELNLSINRGIAHLQDLGITARDATVLRQSITQFNLHAAQFDTQMSGPRDWDKLRQTLSDAQQVVDTAHEQLNQWQTKIRMATMNDSEAALSEVNKLSRLLVGFSIAILAVSAFVLMTLYLRLKDRDQLFRFAFYDSLTGLPNRRTLTQDLSDNLQHTDAGALILLRLERYALLTGTYGHSFGGEVLIAVSQWIQRRLSNSGCTTKLYRFGEDSWAVTVHHSHQARELSELATKLAQLADEPLYVQQRLLNLSGKIGITRYPQDSNDSDQLMRNADAAIHSLSGSNQSYRFYDRELTERTQQWLATEAALRHAIRNHEFELFYQVKIHAKTLKIAGAEALIRWHHNGKTISPAEFIPVAEQSGLIVALGNWVLNEACRQQAQWKAEDRPLYPLAVNVSAQQFADPAFPQTVSDCLARHGIDARLLELEITEEVAAADPQRVVETMQQLKATGVTIALDDFGTGYSSLSYLQRLPIDTLKIDRAFVSGIDTVADNAAIVDMILSLASQGNLKVVAEGVETQAESRLLREKSCTLLQGYLYGRPEPAPTFSERLSNRLPSRAATV